MDDRPRRRQAKTLKQELPYPYNQDLSKVLRGLNRRTPFGRRRLANDPVTAAYLMAAVRLIQHHLGPGASRTLADPDDADSISRPLLRGDIRTSPGECPALEAVLRRGSSLPRLAPAARSHPR